MAEPSVEGDDQRQRPRAVIVLRDVQGKAAPGVRVLIQAEMDEAGG